MPVSVNPLLIGEGAGTRDTMKVVTFTGAASLGAIGTGTVATVTGAVYIEQIIPYCSTNVGVDGGTGAASLQLGVTGATDVFVASTTATDIDAGEFWTTSTPTATTVALPSAMKGIVSNADIKFEVTSSGTQKVTSGVLQFLIVWRPVTSNGGLS